MSTGEQMVAMRGNGAAKGGIRLPEEGRKYPGGLVFRSRPFPAFVTSYTPEEAAEEIKRRQNTELRTEVEKYLGGDVPKILKGGPYAALLRNVPTPNWETKRFLQVASSQLQLPPAVIGYDGDGYSGSNVDKTSRVKMVFHHGYGRSGGPKNVSHTLVRYPIEKKALRDFVTEHGESLVNFHARLFKAVLPNVPVSDESAWLGRQGGKAQNYYRRLSALAVAHAVFCEDFLFNPDEVPFLHAVLFPAMEETQRRFGVHPLMCSIRPQVESALLGDGTPAFHWEWYPGELEEMLPASYFNGKRRPQGVQAGVRHFAAAEKELG